VVLVMDFVQSAIKMSPLVAAFYCN
jgi:hypothetical protein